MTDSALPEDNAPLTPITYLQESFSAWTEFGRRTQKLMYDQTVRMTRTPNLVEENPAETLASEFLRSLSDLNLRHWQNTARLLDSMPSWAAMSVKVPGNSMTDWFDNLQRMRAMATLPIAEHVEAEPTLLNQPDGEADDLTRIKGIGPKLSEKLYELGVYHFRQIAGWDESEAEWIEDSLAFKGRVRREDWIGQARKLSANGDATHH
ncbi:MAG: hypothetical protein AAGJ84_15070 [Pseudomonadota bacterium]